MNAPFRLHALVMGDRRHPPILFLHGFMGCAEDWLETIEHLAGDYFCVVPDLPGHGKSTLPGALVFPMNDALNSIRALLDDMGLKSCHLVGYSMGGRIALHWAVAAPSRCTTLTLVSTSPGLDDENKRVARRDVDNALARQLELASLDEFIEMWYEQPLFESLIRSPRWCEVLARRRRNDSRNLAAALRGLGPAQQDSMWPLLQEIRMPMLVVAGALDTKYVQIADRVADLSGGARRIIVDGVGHSVHLERAGALAAALRTFLYENR